MDTKHNDDTLKTMREPLKERDGQPPSTPQPKKQCYDCKFHGYNKIQDKHACHYYCRELDVWDMEPTYKEYECKNWRKIKD